MSKSASLETLEVEALRAGTIGEQRAVAGTQRAGLRGARDRSECRRGSGRADALQRAWVMTRDMAGSKKRVSLFSAYLSNHLLVWAEDYGPVQELVCRLNNTVLRV